MRAILKSEFNSITEVIHTIIIYDTRMPAGGTPANFILESPGYSLTWDSGITDIVTVGIISSSVEIFVRNTSPTLNVFLSALQIATEGRYIVSILRDNRMFWQGVILSDFSEIADLPDGGVTLSAVDGIGMLEGIDVENINPSKRNSLLEYVIYGLEQIPTSMIPEFSDHFVFIKTNWYSHHMDTVGNKEPMALVSAADTVGHFLWFQDRERVGYDGQKVIDRDKYTVREQIQQILTRFNAVLLMVDGAWHIFQREHLIDNATVTYRIYKADGTMIASIDKDTAAVIGATDDRYRANGTFDMLPGLKSVKGTFLGRWVQSQSGTTGNLLSGNINLGVEEETFQLQHGTGNLLDIRIVFNQKFNTSAVIPNTQGHYRFEVYYRLFIRNGAYILREYGPPGVGVLAWELESSVPSPGLLVKAMTDVRTDPANSSYIYNIVTFFVDRTTPDIPTTDTVKFLLQFDSAVSVQPMYGGVAGGTVTPTSSTLSPQDITVIELLYIYNNQFPTDYATFIQENDDADEYSLNHVLDDGLFGTAGQGSNRFLHVWNGTQWVLSLLHDSKLWNVGEGSVPTYYFTELLVRETLANQAKPLLVFNGDIHERNTLDVSYSYELYTALQLISINYKGSTYKMFFQRIQYNPRVESWSGSWIQGARTQFIGGVTPIIVDIVPPIIRPPLPPPNTEVADMIDIVESITIQKPVFVTEGLPAIITPMQIGLFRQNSVKTPPNDSFDSIGVDKQGNLILKNANEQENVLYTSFGQNVQIMYGYLYNWHAVYGSRGIVNDTDGWRIVIPGDWNNIATYILTNYPDITMDTLGNHAKSTRQVDSPLPGAAVSVHPRWDADENSDPQYGLGTLGLNSLPAGMRDIDVNATFMNCGTQHIVWGNEFNSANAYIALLTNISGDVAITVMDKRRGASVRLIRKATSEEAGYDDFTMVAPYIGNNQISYPAVKVGDYVLLAANLIETKYKDGTIIRNVTSSSWANLTSGAWCSYDNDPTKAYRVVGSSRSTVDESMFEGTGTFGDALRFKNANDSKMYGVRNGVFSEITKNVDGGSPESVYLSTQKIDGGLEL